MIKSYEDFLNEIKAVLPRGWFPTTPVIGPDSTTPVLDGVLAGPATMFEITNLHKDFVAMQTRISTATGIFLDICCLDYLGRQIRRRPNETDPDFRDRILFYIKREKVTRFAVNQIVTYLTGHHPIIIEPRNPGDCGGYSSTIQTPLYVGGRRGYGCGGYYGSMRQPNTFYLKIARPRNIVDAPSTPGYSISGGGYRTSRGRYCSLKTTKVLPTEQEIMDAVKQTVMCPNTAMFQFYDKVSTDMPDVSPFAYVPPPVTITVTRPPASLSLIPELLDFGNVTVGSHSVLPLVARNPGGSDLVITSTALSPPFTINPPSTTTTIHASSSFTYSVTFSPSATGAWTGALTITSSAGFGYVGLRGTGT